MRDRVGERREQKPCRLTQALIIYLFGTGDKKAIILFSIPKTTKKRKNSGKRESERINVWITNIYIYEKNVNEKRNEEQNIPNKKKREKKKRRVKKNKPTNSNLTHNYAYAPNEAIRMPKVHTFKHIMFSCNKQCLVAPAPNPFSTCTHSNEVYTHKHKHTHI